MSIPGIEASGRLFEQSYFEVALTGGLMLLVLISRGKRKPAQFHAGIQSRGSVRTRRAACRGLVMLLHVLMNQDEFKLFREVKLFIFF